MRNQSRHSAWTTRIALSIVLLGGAAWQVWAAEAPKPQETLSSPAEKDDDDTADGEPFPGQLSSKFKIDDRNPEDSVPSAKRRDKNPLEYGYFLQDLLARAEEARQKHDYQAVISYYRAVAKAVPESAKGWSKLCEAYEIVNDRDRAIRACRYALDRPAVEMGDYIRYVQLIVGKEGPLTAEDRKSLDAVLDHLDADPALKVAASHLRCEAGVKAADVAMLEKCTSVLAKLSPNDPKTIVFQWALAMNKGQHSQARQLLERAKLAGVALPNIGRMEKLTNKGLRAWSPVLAIAILMACAAMIWFLMRRRATTRLAR